MAPVNLGCGVRLLRRNVVLARAWCYYGNRMLSVSSASSTPADLHWMHYLSVTNSSGGLCVPNSQSTYVGMLGQREEEERL